MSANTTRHTLVTFNGIPVTIELQWPYHPSPSGSDWFVLHGKMSLEDGVGRWAAISIHLTQVIKESVPSLDAAHTLAASLAVARKAADTKDVEFLKSEKLQPVTMSSRVFGILTKKFTFHKATPEQIAEFVKRKVYWQQKLGAATTDVADDNDALYLGCDKAALQSAAESLASQGLLKLSGGNAIASDALRAQSAAIEDVAHKAVEAIDAKHAYERTVAHH